MSSVSVHIVTYNSAAYIESCLEAVLTQSHPVDKIIVVDNDSHDDTRGRLAPYSSLAEIVWNTENRGFAGAHNQAIRLSGSDYCLILNPDVVLHKDYIRELLNFVECCDNGEIGALTGKLVLQSDPSLVDSCGLTINKARRAFDLGNGQQASQWTEKQEVFGVSGAAALYKRSMIEDISVDGEFFDELFFAYKEDVDVAWRAGLMGWRSWFIPDALAYHERGWKTGGRKSQSLFVRKLSYINRYRMIYKNDSIGSMLPHLIHLLFYELAAFGYAVLREPQLLKTWGNFFRDCKRMKIWRRTVRRKTKNPNTVYTFFIN